MKTFLDFYVYGALDKFLTVAPKDSSLPFVPQSDLDAMGLVGFELLKNTPPVVNNPASENVYTMYRFHEAIAPFFRSGSLLKLDARFSCQPHFRQQPLSLSITKETTAILSAARAPDTSDWRQVVVDRTVYIDFPVGALLLGDRISLSAVFLYPSQDVSECINCVVVLSEAASLRMTGRLFWKIYAKNNSRCTGLMIDGISVELIQENVDHIVRLVLLYWITACNDPRRVSLIPRINRVQSIDFNDKKYKAKLKKSTLFTVSELSPPTNNFGRSIEHCGSWSLTSRIEVSGHFRWQPHGPLHQLRKLIWIDSYEKGFGLEVKPVIKVL